MKCKIGIRPTIDGRWGGIREGLEAQTMAMANSAKKLIEENVFYTDGTPAEVVIAPSTIGGGAEAGKCEEYFVTQNVCATLSVTPCWCYGTETMDLNPLTIKAVWGFNGTERPGAVYLAACMSAHAQRGLPAFSIYGEDVQDMDDSSVPKDVSSKIIRFAQCALAVGQMRNKAYVAIGSVGMGIAGSFLDPILMQNYFGIRAEWVDMVEILRRIDLEIYDKTEYNKALYWVRKNCPIGDDLNATIWGFGGNSKEELDKQFDFTVKMTLIIKDILSGNEKLKELGKNEESFGRNAVLGGFQGQRQWTDYKPNADFTEAILNSSFDWNGKKEPTVLATENDTLNGMSMLLGKLLTQSSTIFADVRTFWSSSAVKRVTGREPVGLAKNGFIHLINSGAAALDATGGSLDDKGNPTIKKWWNITDKDISNMLEKTTWSPANKGYFRGGGFSSSFSTQCQMPLTLIRMNYVEGIGPTLQIAEGYTVELPEDVDALLLGRTDPTWPSTWFVPNITNKGAFTSVYNVMANWGANHGALAYGHIGNDLITLASMLRIHVSMHNVEENLFRPQVWSAFGTENAEGADLAACKTFGGVYA